jgi:Transposase DDE domain
MVVRPSVCLRRLARGRRAAQVGFGRFLANPKVTTERLIEGWSAQTAVAVAGRHVLVPQDTSEFNFSTTPKRRRGLGKIGKGGGHGVLLHAALALDAGTGGCLGLVAGHIWTRRGRVKIAHQKRRTENKESHRWITTAEQAKRVLAAAAQVTVVADRESDIFAQWATTPEPGFHLISRAMHDRRLATGEDLYAAAERFAFTAKRFVALPEREQKRKARPAWLSLRFGTVELARPRKTRDRNLPQSVSLTLVEVVERDAPTGTEAVHWRLLTTHEVKDAAAAWQIVDWYKMRWTIEQFWRLLKLQGLRVEDSQVETAERLIKLTAIAAKAAVTTMQLVQARNAPDREPATLAFSADEIAVLDKLNAELQGATKLQKNPHRNKSLKWASWIIAKLGGWDGYPSSKPPGPITFKHGLEEFHAIVAGWSLRNVCIP